MKRRFNSTILCATVMLAYSCGNTVQQQNSVTETDSIQTEYIIGMLREQHISNNIKLGDVEYTYKYDFTYDESLPTVRNPQGDDYYDNKVRLSIQQGETEIFTRTFTKNDFRNIVPSKFLSSSALVGFTFNYTKTDKTDAFYFIATVGDPDETADMVFPIQIRISPSGNISMEKAENLDTEPINPMKIDPADDGRI